MASTELGGLGVEGGMTGKSGMVGRTTFQAHPVD
mgnify:CR=1 FL=1